MRRPLTLLLLPLLLGAAPAPGPLVLAASSMQEAMNAAADVWARGGRARPVVSFAASPALARQVLAGARADLLVSADGAWMDVLEARGKLRPATRTDLVGNRLVLVAPRGSAATVARARDIPAALAGGRLAMADPASVPAGRYGKAALSRLGVWGAVGPRVVRAENVRAALALVERGAAALGVVYATDARVSRAVRVIATFPAASHSPIRYPLAIPAASRHADAADFRIFLLSPRGQAVFARHGFVRG